MKRNIKRWLAVLCAIMILPWGMWVSTEPQEVKAADETIPEGLERWTIADAGLSDGNHGAFTVTGLTGSMVDTAFVTEIEFTTNQSYLLYIGTAASNKNGQNGLRLQATASGINVCYYKDGTRVNVFNNSAATQIVPSDFGATSFAGTKTEMTLTFESIAGDEDNVKFGIWFDGNLRGNTYYTLPINKTDFVKGLKGDQNGSNGTVYLAAPREVIPETLEKWTIADAGLLDGNYGAFTATGLTGSMVDTAFVTDIEFTTNQSYLLYIGTAASNKNGQNGLRFQATASGINVCYYKDGTRVNVFNNSAATQITPSDFGATAFAGTKTEMTLTFESIAGDENNVKFGIWFDGKLRGNTYYTLPINKTDFIKGLKGDQNGSDGSVYLATPEELLPPQETIPETLEKWTIADAGMNDGNYGAFTATGLTGSMVDTAFVTDIEFTTNQSYLLYIGTAASNKNGQNGLRLQATASGINVCYYKDGTRVNVFNNSAATLITPSDFGATTFVDNKTELTLTFESIPGDEDNVKFGIWFEGRLRQDTYYTLPINKTDFIKGLKGDQNGSDGSVYLATPEELKPAPETIPTDLEKWNIAHVGLDDGEYGTFAGATLEGSLIGTAFTTMVKFNTGKDHAFFVGTAQNGFTFQNNPTLGGLALTHRVSGVKNTSLTTANGGTLILTDANAGVELIDNDNLKLTITVQAIEGSTTQVKLGIWFNDKLYNNEYFTINATAASLPKTLNGTDNSSGQMIYLAVPAGEVIPQPPTVPAYLEKWTIADANIADGATGNLSGTGLSGQLVGTAFTTHMRFDSTGSVNYAIMVGGSDDYFIMQSLTGGNTLQFAYVFDKANSWVEGWNFNAGNGTNRHRVYASDFGWTSFADKDLKMTLTFEPINGSANTALMGIWFNDELYGGEKFTINVTNESLTKGFRTTANNASLYLAEPKYGDVNFDDAVGSVDLVIAKKILAKGWYSPSLDRFNDGTSDGYDFRMIQRFVAKESLAEDYHTELTFADYGYDTTLTVKNPNGQAIRPIGDDTKKESLDGVVIKGNYILSGTNPYFCIGNKNGGVQFYIEEGHLVFCYQDNGGTDKDNIKHETTTLVPLEAVGTSYLDTVIPIQTGFTFMNTSSDGLSTDVIVDVKIGNSYSKTFRVDGVQTSNLQRVIYLNAANSADNSVTLYPEVATLSFDAIGGKDVMPIGGYYGPAVEGIAGAGDVTSFDHFTAATFNDIKAAGVNLLTYVNLNYNEYTNRVNTYVLDLAGNRGMGVFVMDLSLTDQEYDKTDVAQDYGKYLTTDEQAKEQLAKYSSHKAFAGLHVADEPKSDKWMSDSTNKDISYYADAYKRLSELGVVGSSNLFPLKSADGLTETDYENYNQYVEEYCSTCAPSYLCFDYYVWDPSSTGVTQAGYFRNMSIIREKAQEYQIPFWSFIQAGTHWNDKGVKPTLPNLKPRDPEEGEFLWSVNTALACGAKGINYFPLIQKEVYATDSSGNKTIFDFNGLLGADGSKNKWYGYAQTANKQIAAADEYLMNAISDGIIVSGTSATSDTAAFTDRITGTAYNELTGVSGDAIIGCFNYAGKTALYVANYDSDNAQDITLTFDGDYTVTCVDGGVKSDLAITGSGTQLSLVAGEGVLLVFDK